jgi:hypothetical protein
VRDGLLPPYSPLYWGPRVGWGLAARHAMVPLNNAFLYVDDDDKRVGILAEYARMHELSSAYAVIYTLCLHALVFLPAVPLSLLYYSLAEPRYVWEWWAGTVTGRLRPTPPGFAPGLRVVAILLHAVWITAVIAWALGRAGHTGAAIAVLDEAACLLRT